MKPLSWLSIDMQRRIRKTAAVYESREEQCPSGFFVQAALTSFFAASARSRAEGPIMESR
jgi:hypothetical protein